MKRAAAICAAAALAAGVWWSVQDEPAAQLSPHGVAPVAVARPAAEPARGEPVVPPPQAPVPVSQAADAGSAERADRAAGVTGPGGSTPPPIAASAYVGLQVGPDAGAPAAEKDAPRTLQDPRFVVRWGKPGLCLEERAAAAAAMSVTAAGDVRVHHASPLWPELVHEIAFSMVDARQVAAGLVDWSTAAPHPEVYVHDSLDALREASCVNAQAIAYYDGAIHLAVGPQTDLFEVRASLHHEYIHHVLLQLGIQRPMWLHEGLAMFAASESWWKDPRLGLRTWIQSNHLPFSAMVHAFPHTADRLFALAAYFQSERMVTFVVNERGVSFLRVLVRALAAGQLPPEDAFTWAAGLSPSATEVRWSQFVQAQ